MIIRTLIFLFSLCPLLVIGQQVKIRVFATPQQTLVIQDGDTIGKADGAVLHLGFNNRKGIDTHQVIFYAPEFVSDTLGYNSESYKNQSTWVRLLRDLDAFNLNGPLYTDLDEVVSGIDYGTQLGANTRWLYRFDKGVLDAEAEQEMNKALTRLGMQEVARDDPKKVPDSLLLRGEVESYTITRGLRSEKYANTNRKYTASLSIRWKVIEPANADTIYDQPFASIYEYTGSVVTGFHDAVVENFYQMVQEDQSFEDSIAAWQQAPDVIEEFSRSEELEGDSGTVLLPNGEVRLLEVDTIDLVLNKELGVSDESPTDTSSVNQSKEDVHEEREREQMPDAIRNGRTAKSAPRHLLTTKNQAKRLSEVERAIVFWRKGDDDVGSGIHLQNGLFLLAIPDPYTNQGVIRFANGVELTVEERVDAQQGLYLMRTSVIQRKGVLINNFNPDLNALKFALASRAGETGLDWQRCSSEEFQDCLERKSEWRAMPIFDGDNRFVGFYDKTSGWINPQELMRVFNIGYEE